MLITTVIANRISTIHKPKEMKIYLVISPKKTILILWSKNKINSVNKDPAIKKNKNIKVKKMKI